MAQTSKEGDECGGDERGTHYTIQETVRTKRAVQTRESVSATFGSLRNRAGGKIWIYSEEDYVEERRMINRSDNVVNRTAHIFVSS